MLERILPGAVACATSRGDLRGEEAYAVELRTVEHAVPKRRDEFLTGRACARRALAELGVAPQAIPAGERGEPRWPEGIVGSITHCAGFRACAVARAETFSALGIDAEPNQPLPPRVLADIAFGAESAMLSRLAAERPEVSWDRLLFCVKESIYKAWFPLTGRWLGFEDAAVSIDPGGTFEARLLVSPIDVEGRRLEGFSGRWLLADDLLGAATTVAAAARPGAASALADREKAATR